MRRGIPGVAARSGEIRFQRREGRPRRKMGQRLTTPPPAYRCSAPPGANDRVGGHIGNRLLADGSGGLPARQRDAGIRIMRSRASTPEDSRTGTIRGTRP